MAVGRGWEPVLRIAGTVAGLAGGVLTAIWEVFLSPLYAGTVPLPVAPVLAVVTTLGLIWFTRTVTGRDGLALLPGVAWFGVMLVATGATAEGDLLLTGNSWMGLVTILVGALTWGVVGYRLIVRSMRPR